MHVEEDPTPMLDSASNQVDKLSINDESKDIDDLASGQEIFSQNESYQSQNAAKTISAGKLGLSVPIQNQVNILAYENLKGN